MWIYVYSSVTLRSAVAFLRLSSGGPVTVVRAIAASVRTFGDVLMPRMQMAHRVIAVKATRKLAGLNFPVLHICGHARATADTV